MTAQSIQPVRSANPPPSAQANLLDETRPTVDTAAAAYYLNRRPQTLRDWASRQSGVVLPLRVSGRLAWPVSKIKEVMGVTQ